MRTIFHLFCAAAAIATSAAVVLFPVSAQRLAEREQWQPKSGTQRPALRQLPRLRIQARAEQAQLVVDASFGAPLPGLTSAETAAFQLGLAAFNLAQTPARGLGPIMNNRSCVACHGQPTAGGGSGLRVTRFGRSEGGVFDALSSLGGSLLQQNSIDTRIIEIVPSEANTTAQRQSTALFGMGLVEAIPEATILANADAQRALGLNGVPALVRDAASGEMRVGRFGWKAQQATVLAFSADAFVNEMGITNRLFPNENAPNGNATLLAQFDRVADPEDQPDAATGKANFETVADYMRFLAPPPRLPLTPSALQGRDLFSQVGCGGCHKPQMMTGPNEVAALSFKEVNLYSDLLLHDMGTLGDGIADGTAGPRDMKTAPLWGLSASGPYLHDGRAGTVDRAIQLHDGEAAAARNAYQVLNATQRQQLLDFLSSI